MTEPNRPVNTLRIDKAHSRRIVTALNERSQKLANALGSDRRGIRVPLAVDTIFLSMATLTRRLTTYAVAPRNLATGGVAFLHGGPIAQETDCNVIVPMLDGNWVRLEGKTCSCRNLKGHIHEVAVRFNAPIDLTEFTPLNETQAGALASEISRAEVAPQRIALDLIHIVAMFGDPCAITSWQEQLDKPPLKLKPVASSDAAVEQLTAFRDDAGRAGSLLLINQPDRQTTAQLLDTFHTRGVTQPIIVLDHGDDAVRRLGLQSMGASLCVAHDEDPLTLRLRLINLGNADRAHRRSA